MDSSNNGSNRIAPIKTISSNLGIENIIASPPSTFSKTDSDSIHYLSWLFGILLTVTALLPTLFVPLHNVLKEPFYVYEIFVYL